MTACSGVSARSGSRPLSTTPPTNEDGGSRSNRWKWTKPMNRPVGVSSGGRQTKTIAASAGVSSGSRTWASASATVASGARITASVVIKPPAVSSE